MRSVFNNVMLRGVIVAVPKEYIDIQDELAFFGNNPKKLARAQKIVGYGRRHVVPEGVTTTDLCCIAAQNLFDNMEIDPQNCEALIFISQSPDYRHPASACILQDQLGISTQCAAFDISLGCSGYVYGLWLAHSLIASKACKNVLLCAGDTPSIYSDKKNRKVNPLFGDAGSATWLEYTKDEHTAFFEVGTQGSGWSHLILPAGGTRLPITQEILTDIITDEVGNPWRLCEAIIDGQAVFDFSIKTVPNSIKTVLHLANKDLSDIDFIALHQANKQIIDEISIRLGLDKGIIYSGTFSKYGNQSTASVAGVLCDAKEAISQTNPSTLLLSGFGVGFSWASAIITVENLINGGIIFYTKPPACPSRDAQIAFWKQKFRQGGL